MLSHHATVRPATESDREALRLFFDALPSQMSFQRFFGGGFRATDAMLDVLLGIRLPGRAFVAEGGGEIVGHRCGTSWTGSSTTRSRCAKRCTPPRDGRTTRTAVTLSYDSGTSALEGFRNGDLGAVSGVQHPTAMSPAAIAGLHLDRSTLWRTT